MKKECFENWLQANKDYAEGTIKSRISNCKRVERYEGDLDDHFNRDNLNSLIESLEYSTQDQQLQKKPKHNIPIDGDIRNGTATLKQAIKLYREFRCSEDSKNFGQANYMCKKKSRNQSKECKEWPKWEQPDGETLWKIAKRVVPYVQFLHPQIIRKITENNRKYRDKWSDKLKKCGVDPNIYNNIYLWEDSPCAFPVRRSTNEERQNSNKKPPDDCLCLDPDGNTFPKHLWAFALTGCEFRKRGPEGYQLAHLFDHKVYKSGLNKDRWQKEMEGGDPKNPPKLFGLFASPANTVYVPSEFQSLTDFSHKFRTLLQRKASELYGDVCQILPPPLKVKDCNDPKWDIKEFEFGPPLGDVKNVCQFLEFRCKKMKELFKEFCSKRP